MKKLSLLLVLFLCTKAFSQTQDSNIDPAWDNYYNQHPTEISQVKSGGDFLSWKNLFSIHTNGKMFHGDDDLFDKTILNLDSKTITQLIIDGDYYSRTYKHNDYFTLYNLCYGKTNPIQKAVWDEYCPYLIAIMEIDGTIVH